MLQSFKVFFFCVSPSEMCDGDELKFLSVPEVRLLCWTVKSRCHRFKQQKVQLLYCGIQVSKLYHVELDVLCRCRVGTS